MIDDELGEKVSIEITPLATVGLLLVVIFLGTSNSWVQPLLKVDLPKASTGESERKQNVTVSVGLGNELAVDSVNIGWENLSDGLILSLRHKKDKFVIIRADKKVSYDKIVRIMSIAKRAGAKSITIATEQKNVKLEEKK
jgi:biopolymer transport protein ExbD